MSRKNTLERIPAEGGTIARAQLFLKVNIPLSCFELLACFCFALDLSP